MGKLFKILTLLVFYLTASGLCQEREYYYSNNRRIYIDRSENYILVNIKPEYVHWFIYEFHHENVISNTIKNEERGFFLLEFKHKNNMLTFVELVSKENFLTEILPVYLMPGSDDISSLNIIADEFVVKLADGYTVQDIRNINENYGVEIVSFNKFNEYVLRKNQGSKYSTLELANLYYENDLTLWSHPDFIGDLRPHSDPYYQHQYYLKNIGQGGGTPGVDINIEPVWLYTKGNSDVIVAVLDDGVMQHEDFYTGQIITGYSPHGGTDPPYSAAHGMNCAGIIAANHNELGVRGIAPNVKIMPIRFIYGSITSSQIAYSIDWAWDDGKADVLSNSWGYTGINTWFDNIAEAIGRAQSNGRDGKGSLVVFSAGNTSSYTQFPAKISSVVAVGSVDKNNNRWNYSPNDYGVDIIAPSGDIHYGGCDHRGDIWSTDRHPDGYSPCGGNYLGDSQGKYFAKFGGTSGAAPQVSAIGALLISMNPDILLNTLKNTLYNTADDYGSTNWDGAGRVNAFNAFIEVRDLMDLQTLNNDPTALNGGRKMVKSNDGRYHLVYANAGAIYYSFSTNNGNVWSFPLRLSSEYDLSFESKYPSIASHKNYLFVTWQVNFGGYYKIDAVYFQPGQTEWKYIEMGATSDVEPIPVLVAADNVDNNWQSEQGAPEVMIVYRKSDGLYHDNCIYVWVSGTGYMYGTLTQAKITGTNSAVRNPSIAVNGLGKIMVTCNTYNGDMGAFYTNGGSWSSYPNYYFWATGVTNYKNTSVTSDWLNDFHIVYEGDNYYYETESILHKVIKWYGDPTLPISEFSQSYTSDYPSTFGHMDNSNGGISIYWNSYLGDDCYIRKVVHNGYSWDHTWNNFVNPIQTDANFVASVDRDHPNNFAYIWTSLQDYPYSIESDIYNSGQQEEDTPDELLPTDFSNGSVISYRSLEAKKPSIDLIFSARLGNLRLKSAFGEEIKLDIEKWGENLSNPLRSLASDSVRHPNLFTEVSCDYSITAKNLHRIVTGNTPTMNFVLIDRINRDTIYYSENFNIPLDSSLYNLNGTFNVPLTNLSQNDIISLALKFRNIELRNLNGININTVNTYLLDENRLGKTHINQIKPIVQHYNLYQNYPNPFNPVTTIKYDIIKAQDVKLVVYDMLGREVAILVNEQQQPGSYEVSWDASNFASGIYFYSLTSGNFMATKKLILLK